MNAQTLLLLAGSLCCFALALTQSAQAAASNNQESNNFQSSQQEQRESISPLMMTSDDQDDGLYQGARVVQSLAPNSPYQQERMDRIKFALTKFLAPVADSPNQLNSRLQIRSVPAPYMVTEQEMSNFYDQLNLQERQRGAIQTRDEHQRLAPGSGSASASSGHKTIRNAQPVFMRLPPRFGKRSFWA